MKNTSTVILLCLFWTATAHAASSWQDIFLSTFQESGIQNAVPEALEKGITPDAIIKEGLAIAGVPPQGMLKALYCSGADGDDIKTSALANGIPERVLVVAYEKSVDECGDMIEAPEAYSPYAAGPGFAGGPTPGTSPLGGNGSFASPSIP
jgi:hypothetical protein